MRVRAILVCIVLLSAVCFGGSPNRGRSRELELRLGDETQKGQHLAYSIAHPESVREAWIEVLDRPLLLARTPVAVQAHGEFDWNWDPDGHNDWQWEDPDDELSVSLWDPNGHSIVCVGTTMLAQPGGEVSPMTIGDRGKFLPDPRLDQSLVRVAEGSPQVRFEVRGTDLTPEANFHVHVEKGAVACKNRFVHAEVLSLSKVNITVDGECLHQAGAFYISPEADPREDQAAWVYVASRTSPVLQSVSPSTLPPDLPQDKLELVVRGSGFTKDSNLFAGYFPVVGLEDQQVPLDTDYISPTELRASVDSSFGHDILGKGVWSAGDRLRLWVKGSEEKFELSEAKDIELSPGTERPRKTARITSVSPFPIRLMDQHSPTELKLTVRGENFIPENKVVAHFGNIHLEVRTEYVSPHMMRAWIPRQLWRKHQLRYRLVVETIAGRRYVQQVDDKGDE
jgi:hypothetical protein